MKKIIRKFIGAFFGLIVVLYIGTFLTRAANEPLIEIENVDTTLHSTVAVFGATGTIGDGLLKAALNDPQVDRIHVVTRRPSPRIEEGVSSGKVVMTILKEYHDFSGIRDLLADVDAVYWAIGLSAVGLDEETYREIHTTYPMRFVAEWLQAGEKEKLSFHYVSGSGANAESRMMWAREKAHAENELTKLADGSRLNIISYRPSFILPTEAEVHLGHRVLYAIFAPLRSAVAAQAIGEAMVEISARGQQLPNGTILENSDIISYAQAYEARHTD